MNKLILKQLDEYDIHTVGTALKYFDPRNLYETTVERYQRFGWRCFVTKECDLKNVFYNKLIK